MLIELVRCNAATLTLWLLKATATATQLASPFLVPVPDAVAIVILLTREGQKYYRHTHIRITAVGAYVCVRILCYIFAASFHNSALSAAFTMRFVFDLFEKLFYI